MSTHAPPIATLTVPSQPAYLIVCRQALIGAVAGLAVTDDQLDDLKLLLSEACSNAIVHGYDNDPNGEIEIEFRASPHEIEVSVSDNGRGFPGGRIPDLPGFGLSLLHELSTRHRIDPQRPQGGARVSFARSINR
jgi:anti-sigma regulatory factor (Ser/Thr protein kinase)